MAADPMDDLGRGDVAARNVEALLAAAAGPDREEAVLGASLEVVDGDVARETVVLLTAVASLTIDWVASMRGVLRGDVVADVLAPAPVELERLHIEVAEFVENNG